MVDEGEPIRSTVGLHPTTLDVSFERCYFWSIYNRPWCRKCQGLNSYQEPFDSPWLNVVPSKNLGLKLTDQQLGISLFYHLCAKNCEKDTSRCGKLGGEKGLMVFPVRGTLLEAPILSWNKRWVPSKFPQFWNNMEWPEQTESAQMEIPWRPGMKASN